MGISQRFSLLYVGKGVTAPLLSLVLLAQAPATPEYSVQPIILVPNDFQVRPEYARAATRAVDEVREWFRGRLGTTFSLAPTLQVTSQLTYSEMKLGAAEPDPSNPNFMPNWFTGVQGSIGGLRARRVLVVFAVGGGGFTTGRMEGDQAGIAVVGDWVLGPLARVVDPRAITAPAGAWQVRGNAPMGILTARIGQAFGLLNPRGYSGPSLVGGFQSWPSVGFMPHETLALQNSPFFGMAAPERDTPVLDAITADLGIWGQPFVVMGQGLRAGDMVEVLHIGVQRDGVWSRPRGTSNFMELKVESPTRASFVVPPETGPGFIRLWRGTNRSAPVPVNFYERAP